MKVRLPAAGWIKRVALLLTPLLLACAVFAGDEPVVLPSLKLDGNVVKNVRVKDATPTDVTILFDGGGTKLKRKDLPSELKALYPYDPKAAAEYEKQQAAEHAERNQDAKVKQDQANRERKTALLQQQQYIQGHITNLENQLTELEKEMGPMKGKARGKPKSTARVELDAARDKKEDLIKQIGEQKSQLEKINKQIATLP
jgi:hypothetical protein